ncbi:hypothetical protein A2331_00845 [Candidatus Falkowbacteria bacterium RIFOXYB2_FULL_34_18]|uniref:Uncharacterized protein n=1 Tax=Candidatus Falkowbacteria bacterium RIFOXYD2_FULL_34_120 TaxID=1798007 RepID=A0A1F5TM12_9BACT|nr:MAG: hypothetical protein A2331_00845 [Candidatus Falkowbacteria bacterium RIFOXYB2_FULL_34_18]OGF29236.1 MAG: hypothetical protein A2500_06160 [Candidatus Falkowbacteria bacterium RIFOXYC12_FULL_34_55]OGF37774.1 MAG: hypothetical protein A2466_06490 [Candidatus Falkowbacteria bacterium RIFOXYC2_FULL_34_220]OGF38758.1 MAG: hypothetical protein A2515_01825 [Candidatus Falkowbacteria bacterium RIFOXYD12_FULL_34_57]OGF39992.1 MAG: hypothetical protein A2531_02080 [Candidatus Falkowbacteria bact
MDLKIRFEVTRNGLGLINGVKLKSQEGHETKTSIFCETFPVAFLNGTANIRFEDDKIIFEHPKCDPLTECYFKLKPQVINELRLAFNQKNEFNMEKWTNWGFGFGLYVKDI